MWCADIPKICSQCGSYPDDPEVTKRKTNYYKRYALGSAADYLEEIPNIKDRKDPAKKGFKRIALTCFFSLSFFCKPKTPPKTKQEDQECQGEQGGSKVHQDRRVRQGTPVTQLRKANNMPKGSQVSRAPKAYHVPQGGEAKKADHVAQGIKVDQDKACHVCQSVQVAKADKACQFPQNPQINIIYENIQTKQAQGHQIFQARQMSPLHYNDYDRLVGFGTSGQEILKF